MKSHTSYVRVPPEEVGWRSVTLEIVPFAERMHIARAPCCEKDMTFIVTSYNSNNNHNNDSKKPQKNPQKEKLLDIETVQSICVFKLIVRGVQITDQLEIKGWLHAWEIRPILHW